MAVYFVKPGITVGTGAGTVGDPWDIQTTMSSGNTNGLSVGDVIACMTNGATAYAPTTNLYPPTHQVLAVPVDYSGIPTNNLALVDGTSIGSFEILRNQSAIWTMVAGMKFFNGPSHGILLNQRGNIVYNCWVADCSSLGINTGGTTEGLLISNNRISGCNGGVAVRDYSYPSVINYNYIEDCGNSDYIIAENGLVHGNVIRYTGVGTGTGSGIISINAPPLGLSIAHNTVYVESGLTDTLYGLYTISDASPMAVTDNIFESADGGAWDTAFQASAATGWGLVKSNIVRGFNAVANANVSNSTLYETPASTDPNFTNPTSGNMVPQVDLVGAAWVSKIALETAWIDIGALSSDIGGGGGGGGLLVHPGMAGGMRG